MGTIPSWRDFGQDLVVGYTESQAFWTSHRLKRTGLDLRIDYLYSAAPDHDLPHGISPEPIRSNPEEYYQLRHTSSVPAFRISSRVSITPS
jgi:phosphoglycolate phosphatase